VNQRYLSLDIFRGATVAFMILVNNPGTWSHIFDPLEHADWHGLTPTDLVFPFFLFAVGNAMSFVIPRLRDQGNSVFFTKVLKRTIIIFLVGTFLNWFPFVHWQNEELVLRGWEWIKEDGQTAGIRVLGTLQRISLCYFFASLIVYQLGSRALVFTSGLILLAYWLLCILMNPSDPFSFEGWFGKEIDLTVFGTVHVYRGDGIPFENEGLISTLPATVQVLMGFLAGDFIRRRSQKVSGAAETTRWSVLYRTLAELLVAAAIVLAFGYLWSLVFPINKKIQSSSFILVAAGFASTALGLLIYFIDIKARGGWWSRFFTVFGKNALFIYALSELLPRLSRLIRIRYTVVENGQIDFVNPLDWLYQNICAHVPGPPEFGSLLYALLIVVVYWGIGYWMDKKKIYIRA
jgi:predicted acyltransferase